VPLRIAFLGPFGTFTEQAVRQVASPDAVLLPMTSAPQALAAVRNGQADRAVVPIENSIEGGVNATLDALAHGQPLVIVGEMHVSVVFQLAVRPGTTPEQVRRIGTHPHAWAQCRGWVESTFPGAVHVPAPPPPPPPPRRPPRRGRGGGGGGGGFVCALYEVGRGKV